MRRTPGVTRQGCYQWASRPDSAHDLRDRELARLVGDEHDASMGIYRAPKAFMRLRQKGVRTSPQAHRQDHVRAWLEWRRPRMRQAPGRGREARRQEGSA